MHDFLPNVSNEASCQTTERFLEFLNVDDQNSEASGHNEHCQSDDPHDSADDSQDQCNDSSRASECDQIAIELGEAFEDATESDDADPSVGTVAVSYTHLTLPTTPYV